MMTNGRAEGSVSYDNQGRIVVVTGGCSGIGLAICRAFLQSQATTICLDIDARAAAALEPGLHFREVDASQEEQCRAAMGWIEETFGGIDVLVNNAAIQPPESYQPVVGYSRELWERMIGVNLSGYMYMAKHALPVMLRQQQGVIVNLASGQGHRTARQVPAYGPIKAANIMQARQWGIEYARQGIRVISVSPGAIDTPLVRASLASQGGVGELANRHPLGRIGQPEEVAAAVLWLASGEASFITATDLEVDGGLGAFAAFAEPYSAE